MIAVRKLTRVPGNFSAFIDEIGAGLRELYGPAAEKQYRASAKGGMRATLANPEVTAFAAFADSRVAGYIVCVVQENAGQIVFIHVLNEFNGNGIEDALVTESVNYLRDDAQCDNIVAECVSHCPLELDSVYDRLGFRLVERALMRAASAEPRLASQAARSRELHPAEARDAARVIVASFRGHAGRDLHTEVRTIDGAYGFIRNVRSGSYGAFRPEYGRVIEADGNFAGVILGCEVAPDVGFILMVSVMPDSQGNGLGGALVRELTRTFRESGMRDVALGVSVDNPAMRLYERLGFSPVRSIHAYIARD